MNVATLTNSLKALFGTAASSTAITSTDLVPFMNSSGTPSGLSSTSQLASVLGVSTKTYKYLRDNATAQANGYPEWGHWYIFNNICTPNSILTFCFKIGGDIGLYCKETKRNGDESYSTIWYKVPLTIVQV